jgi:uncharacterized membrane protein
MILHSKQPIITEKNIEINTIKTAIFGVFSFVFAK